MKISQEIFGNQGNTEVYLFKISHPSGAFIQITNYGATWVSALIPDNHGKLADVLLGYNSLEGYLSDTNYMGSTIGRFANRINQAGFTLEGQTYKLDKNDGENTNHGGYSGFDNQVFDYEVTGNAVVFTLISPDGEGGFPGDVTLNVSYSFSNDSKVIIHFWGTTDKDTYLNLTNHTYFNLSNSDTILNHLLQIPSERILVTNESFIPTGEYMPVEGTVFDFTGTKTVGERIYEQDLQLIRNRGYNHCYPLDSPNENELTRLAATLIDPASSRQLQVFTTLPSVLIYSAGFLNSAMPGKSGTCHHPLEGICLEAQFYPDSPNQPLFPSCLLRKGEIYDHCIEYHFTTVQ